MGCAAWSPGGPGHLPLDARAWLAVGIPAGCADCPATSAGTSAGTCAGGVKHAMAQYYCICVHVYVCMYSYRKRARVDEIR